MGEGDDQATEGPGHETTPSAELIAPLRWIAVGSLIALGVVSIQVGRWSLASVGLLALAWGAFTACLDSTSPSARRRWAVASGATLGAVLADVVYWNAGGWALVVVLCGDLLALNALAWALAAATDEHQLPVAARWRVNALLLAPASVLYLAGAAFTVRVGTEVEEFANGWTSEVSGVEFTLPGGSWPVVVGTAVPLVAVAAWGLGLFVSTYRQAGSTGETDLTRPQPARPMGTV